MGGFLLRNTTTTTIMCCAFPDNFTSAWSNSWYAARGSIFAVVVGGIFLLKQFHPPVAVWFKKKQFHHTVFPRRARPSLGRALKGEQTRRIPALTGRGYVSSAANMAGIPLFAHAGREKITPPPLSAPLELIKFCGSKTQISLI